MGSHRSATIGGAQNDLYNPELITLIISVINSGL